MSENMSGRVGPRVALVQDLERVASNSLSGYGRSCDIGFTC